MFCHRDAIGLTDEAVVGAVEDEMGSGAQLSESETAQVIRPISHGGLGRRLSSEVRDAAAVGGFATAAYLDRGIGQMLPALRDVAEHPDEHSHLPHIAEVKAAWGRILVSCPHARILASAVAAGVICSTDENNLEGEYEEAWKRGVLRGEEMSEGQETHADIDQRLTDATQAKMDAIGAEALSDERRDWVAHPEDHLEIVRLLSDVDWVNRYRWPIQKLLSRAQDRTRQEQLAASILDLDERAHYRSQCTGMASIPFLAVPNNPGSTLSDAEMTYLMNARLGKKQPSTLPLGPQCTCAHGTPIGNGRHLRTCSKGGGRNLVHNIVRDRIGAAAANAGCVHRTEVPNLLPGNERPADVLIVGIGRNGADLAIDTVVTSTLSTGLNPNEVARRGWQVGRAARRAEAKKNAKTQDGVGLGMKDRLAAVGVEFVPVGFEVSGAQGSGFRTVIKRLSECAVQRRGHDKRYFVRRWTVDIAMVIAKRGAQAALNRAYAVGCEQRYGWRGADVNGDDGGQLGGEDAELPLLAGGGG